jgi:hypothetical protein
MIPEDCREARSGERLSYHLGKVPPVEVKITLRRAI